MKRTGPMMGALASFIIIIVVIITFSLLTVPVSEEVECETNEDCVPAQCCHPTSCVNKELKPDCTGIFCTMECAPGTMDCGQGYCACADNKCVVVWSE